MSASRTWTPPTARGGHARLIDPAVLARLDNLELLARSVVEGTLVGLHRSPRLGFSQEFAEFRAYMPGDDLRSIDWNVLARTDRLYTRRYFGDTNCRLLLLLDSSASMDMPARGGPVSKLDYARFFAAALAYLAHRQHDALGLVTFDDQVRSYLPPSARAAGVAAVYRELDHLEAAGGSNWQSPLDHVQQQFRKAGLIVLISDFYTAPDELAKTLRGLAARGHDLLLVHVLDREERSPHLARAATFRDIETGEVIEVTREELTREYPSRLSVHIEAIRRNTLAMGGHYLQVNTDEPLDRILAGYLRFRARHP